jgi:beta-galactosidase/beta-glucuronidase
MTIRNEYPRPQFVRKNWTNLNGQWDFTFDDDNQGISAGWFRGDVAFDKTITVPYVYQSELSGINDRTPHDVVWYKREFEVDFNTTQEDVILHFGAVDYEADIYVNGEHVLHHIGGHTSFEADVTPFLKPSETNTLVVRAFDPHTDESIPRGKQIWEEESVSIWYTNSTGIWQPVWLEVVDKVRLNTVRLTPRYDEGQVRIEAFASRIVPNLRIAYDITFKDQPVASGSLNFVKNRLDFSVDLLQEYIFRTNYHNDGWTWTPENPNLFDITFRLVVDETVHDEVETYFGLRKIHQEKGMVYLNNRPYYQKLVLDQGYWPTGLMTAPTDDDLIKDIELAKEMGFNGCRKHQKTEDPRFLYHADRLGYLVWGECAAPTIYNNDAVSRLMHEWTEIVERDYNHPSIVTWVPINESWGVPNISQDRQQQHFSQTMYHFLHSLDTTRLVISNDGWALTETDITAIHNYNHGQKDEVQKYEFFKKTLATRDSILTLFPSPWPIYANGFESKGEPCLLTEFGGVGFDVSGQPGWGYTSVENEADYLEDYKRIMDAVYASEVLYGYCYTQLTDVEQEINGILTYDRQPKCDLAKIREINDGYHNDKI